MNLLIYSPSHLGSRCLHLYLAGWMLLGLTGCKTTYDTAADNAEPLPDALIDTSEDPDPATEPSDWWTVFGDETLNQLIERALAENFSVRSAWDRLAQANAILRRAGSDQKVQLDGTAGLTQRWQETNGRDSDRTSFSVGLAASYEVDLWGRIQNTVQAAELDAVSSRFAIDTAAISISAQVADGYFRHRVNRAQLQLIDSQIQTNQDVLELLRERFATGTSTAQDVLRQRQLIEATRSERIETDANGRLIESELAVLLGMTELDEATRQSLETSATQALVPAYLLTNIAVVPSQAVFRRPDLTQQFAEIRSADARVAAAMADKYPRLSLSASANFEDEGVKDLFDNWVITLAANLTAPLLDGGRRDAEVQRTQAVLSEQVNAYAQTTLEAIREIQDALTIEARQREQLVNIDSRLTISKQVLETIGNSYRNGASSYLDVLDALDRDQTLERQRLSEQQRAISARITLHRTIAGSVRLTEPKPSTLVGSNSDHPDA